ncbi:MAG: LrgB family protein [Clostridiales bacterium]|jgi:predicted murein hydrolase (TIGR00659 family)|nr:LrgB family protein [Clostridiales bacterium]
MTEFFSIITSSIFFGILLTIGTFRIGQWIVKKTGIKAFNPLLTSIILTIAFLLLFKVDYEDYNKGASYISALLGPATVALAVPLYKQVNLLKKNLVLILISVTAGAVSAVAGVYLMSKLFSLQPEIFYSIMPKSVTAAIALGITEEAGGIGVLTLFAITVTGMTGSTCALGACKLFGIHDRMAVGLSMGTCAHAIGTSVALERGELEGAMSSLAIVVAGFVTVFIAPFIVYV